MLPSIQLDENLENILISDSNKIVWINLDQIHEYKPSYYQINQFNNRKFSYSSYISDKFNAYFKNDIKILKTLEIFEYKDVRSFRKKNNTLLSFSE